MLASHMHNSRPEPPAQHALEPASEDARVNQRRANRIWARSRQRGFSLLEMMVVVLIIMLILGMVILQLQPMLASSRADSAMKEVVDELRQAREYSISNRRYVQVSFITQIVGGQTLYEVQSTQMNTLTTGGGAVNPVLRTTPIEAPMTFYLTPNMNDTPDAFGNASAIEFGGIAGGPVTGMLFQSDGELVAGGTYLPINGTVFLGKAGIAPSLARAVTVLGTTGRVRGWKALGLNWTQF